MRSRVIAVVGPDGAGKTTLCDALRREGVCVIYAGRGTAFQWYMHVANRVRAWFSKAPLKRLSPIYMWLAFYPLEAISWSRRLERIQESTERVVIVERCMLDRLALLITLESSAAGAGAGIKRSLARLFFSRYWTLAKSLSGVLVIAGAPRDLLQRRPDYYRSIREAEVWVTAYRQLAQRLAHEMSVPVVAAEQMQVSEALREIHTFAGEQ
jgi:hypothetical protein